MGKVTSFLKSLNPYSEEQLAQKAKLSQIDRSMRGASLFFLSFSVIWLMVGTAFAIISSVKLHHPSFLADSAWLTFGRTRSAHLNAVAFGWVNNAIYAVALWIMARLCKNEVRHNGLLYVAGLFWNIAVFIGLIGILTGDLTSVEWLEFPTYVTPLLAFSYVLIGVWGVIAFRFRKGEHVYVSEWYILAALFWFPWLYTIVQMMIFFHPAQGVIQAIVNWWFAHNVLGLWMTPMGLAAVYYLIPKVLGRPIHSYFLSVYGFWTLAFFYNWAGMHHLIEGPVPVWVITLGIVGSVMMLFPVVVTAINHHMTCMGLFKQVWVSPTLRFIVFGAMNYTLASALGSAMALRDVNEVTHFTHFTVGHAHHGAYAFLTMVLFGSIYFMMPRLLAREWPSGRLISIHFWCTSLGVVIMVIALSAGGWLQGLNMNDASIPFLDVVAKTLPWLISRTFSGVLIAIGHFAFFINFFWMLSGHYAKRTGPTLLINRKRQEMPA